jgi:hypothetical protein
MKRTFEDQIFEGGFRIDLKYIRGYLGLTEEVMEQPSHLRPSTKRPQGPPSKILFSSH